MAKKKIVRVKKGFFGTTASKAKGIYSSTLGVVSAVGATVAGVLIAGRINGARR
jgi:hypothetical protein